MLIVTTWTRQFNISIPVINKCLYPVDEESIVDCCLLSMRVNIIQKNMIYNLIYDNDMTVSCHNENSIFVWLSEMKNSLLRWNKSLIITSHHLRCCDKYSSHRWCCWEVLHNAEVLVTGPGWSVHHQVVQGTPVNIPEKLFDHAWEREILWFTLSWAMCIRDYMKPNTLRLGMRRKNKLREDMIERVYWGRDSGDVERWRGGEDKQMKGRK